MMHFKKNLIQGGAISFQAALAKSGISDFSLKNANTQELLAKQVFNAFGDPQKSDQDKATLHNKLVTLLVADGRCDKDKVTKAVEKFERLASSNAKGQQGGRSL